MFLSKPYARHQRPLSMKRKVHRFISGKDCKHIPWTHFPKDPNCPFCNEVKRSRAQCRSKVHGKPGDLPQPLKCAGSLTGDHKILNDDDASRVSECQ